MSQQHQAANNNQLPPNGPSADCRRRVKDRRQRPTPLLSKYTFTGSRKSNRRQDDQPHSYYVDIYGRKVTGLILLIFSLCIVDAILTLTLLGRGASELNPVMDYYLKFGSNYFIIFKLVSSGIGVLVLLIHHNFKRVQTVISGLCALYTLLISYQLTLLIVSMMS